MHNHLNHPSSASFSLLSPATQVHMHELAKTLPPPRKQNTACDACRTRKVKCNRVPGSDKCQHCMAKNYPCTNYVQQATAQKRHAGSGRRPRTLSASNSTYQSPTSPFKLSPQESIAPLLPGFSQSSPSFHQSLRYPPITRDTPTVQLLAYVFSPPETLDGQRGSYSEWGPEANNLDIETFRNDLALDLVEVFFQIVHPRFPLLNPTQFRSQLCIPSSTNSSLPTKQEKPLHPALIAAILAWGAKFTENSFFVADRQRNPESQSILAKTLVHRARELAEALKVHRIASPENVVISLLIECLQNQSPDDPSGFSRFWLTCSIRFLLDLQINHKSVMSNISDSEERGTMIFAWWMALLSDAYSSVYYRRKPMLDDDDYDIDFYTADPVSPPDLSDGQKLPSSREQLEFIGYYRANHALARIARYMSRNFWKPITESDGIPVETLTFLIQSLWDWKNEHLAKVGVPSTSTMQAEWDFISAISACASDATYHIMWIVLFNALDDYGIKEQRNRSQSPMSDQQRDPEEIERIKKNVLDEALHGALRIAGLTGVLASNGYLRLDPAVMMASCIHSGILLARLGRPEASNCISGLQQYSYAYEEAAENASEMSRILQSGDGDLNHMASVVPRMSSASPSPMNVGIRLPTTSGGEQPTFFG